MTATTQRQPLVIKIRCDDFIAKLSTKEFSIEQRKEDSPREYVAVVGYEIFSFLNIRVRRKDPVDITVSMKQEVIIHRMSAIH